MTARDTGPARHELPDIDAAALATARGAEKLHGAARDRGLTRWEEFLAPLPDLLRDGDLRDLRGAARRARSAYGAKDSIRDALPGDLTEPFLADLDRLLKLLARDSAEHRR